MISTAHFASPHVCLGQSLHVPTIGQALLMEGFGVWPGIEQVTIEQQFSGLILSIGILTRSHESYYSWVGGWFANRYHKRLWKRLGDSKGLSELRGYSHWLKTIQRMPPMVGTQNAESFRIGVGPVGHLIVKLAMEFGWSEEAIKNLKYPVAMWYSIGIDERLRLAQIQSESEMDSFRSAMENDDVFEAIMRGGRG